jgi:hypothetical protein
MIGQLVAAVAVDLPTVCLPQKGFTSVDHLSEKFSFGDSLSMGTHIHKATGMHCATI